MISFILRTKSERSSFAPSNVAVPFAMRLRVVDLPSKGGVLLAG